MGANGAARKGLPPGSDDDNTIKVMPKKSSKNGNGTIKLKKPAPKHNKPGNWRDGSVIDDDKKKSSAPSTNTSSPAPPVVNQLDDHARDTFPTGRPMEDALEQMLCKHCKKSVLKTIISKHVVECLRVKREKAQKKKEQKEAREREKKEAERGMESDGDDGSGEEGNKAVKGMKKSAGKKVEVEDKKGKKRKADGEGEKGPSKKKKKEELKIKAPKAKGMLCFSLLPHCHLGWSMLEVWRMLSSRLKKDGQDVPIAVGEELVGRIGRRNLDFLRVLLSSGH